MCRLFSSTYGLPRPPARFRSAKNQGVMNHRNLILPHVLLAMAVVACAQTAIDLKTQSKSVDFSAAATTKLFKTGTSLPATCSVGESYFKSDALNGDHLYGCTAPNSWALFGAARPNYGVSFSSQTTVLIPAAVHGFASANLTVDCFDSGTPARNIEPNAVTIDAVSYDVTVSFYSAQTGKCAINGSGGGGVTIASNSGVAVDPGVGVTVATASGRATVSIDTAVVPTYLTGSASLNFNAIPAASCTEVTLPLNGAATGDAVSAGWPPTLGAGLAGTMFVPAGNTIAVRLCNVTTSSIEGFLADFRATIVRNF